MPRIDLSEPAGSTASRSILPLGLASLGSLLAAPLYILLLDIPLVRSTAAPGFLLLAIGAITGAIYARADERFWVRATGAANVIALAFAVIWFFWLASLPAPDARATSLTHAPLFHLPDQHGRDISLRDVNSGGPVLLVFYRGSWCPFCVSELRGLRGIQKELKAAGVRVLAVSVDAPHKSEQAAERLDLGFPLLSDVERRVIADYGVVDRGGGPGGEDIAIPAHFLLDIEGRIVWRRVAGRVQSRAGPQEVLKAAREHFGRAAAVKPNANDRS